MNSCFTLSASAERPASGRSWAGECVAVAAQSMQHSAAIAYRMGTGKCAIVSVSSMPAFRSLFGNGCEKKLRIGVRRKLVAADRRRDQHRIAARKELAAAVLRDGNRTFDDEENFKRAPVCTHERTGFMHQRAREREF